MNNELIEKIKSLLEAGRMIQKEYKDDLENAEAHFDMENAINHLSDAIFELEKESEPRNWEESLREDEAKRGER